jgi:hypothetical protein
MSRQFYLELAHRGIRMPIGTDLVLHESADPEWVRLDGLALGSIIAQAARRWGTPLAIPLMDLRLEKIDLLALAGTPEAEAEAFHFQSPLDEPLLHRLCGEQNACFQPGSIGAIGHCATSARTPISCPLE